MGMEGKDGDGGFVIGGYDCGDKESSYCVATL